MLFSKRGNFGVTLWFFTAMMSLTIAILNTNIYIHVREYRNLAATWKLTCAHS